MDIATPRKPSPLENDTPAPIPVPGEPVYDDADFEPTIVRGRE
ncbi:hypothetical protein FHX82_004222 [Amycolatopsis bartoniae]|uniref:Uncharacterized protein n=1 Tax=Amycolatopsis bartoniae TaxID=941986 RepID=A0A8H9MCC0_9PSEU|nr:hypothetical protein [Amycolatopsis bartoniae]MBB2937158.1 hypothetical protein [Amycolatopsis bartoniae]GHF52867.1 hypothetical protein GCM10017566_27810 [Amycolatopsis bartoniae]